jgi:hypothetical protein
MFPFGKVDMRLYQTATYFPVGQNARFETIIIGGAKTKKERREK